MLTRLTRNRLRKLDETSAVAVKQKRKVAHSPKKKPRKPTTQQATDIEDAATSSSSWSPAFWRTHFDNIREMRAKFDAPVDSMGCEKCHDVNAPLKVQHYQILLSLMLSSQTKDEITNATMQRLREHGCTQENIALTSEAQLAELLYPVSFYKTKAKSIKRTTDLLIQNHNGEVPASVEELCKLPGVGPKMAHLVMLIAFKQCTGIAVDTHVHRIANRLGWTSKTTKTPEQTRQCLESFIPRDKWEEINLLLVGFGQQTCVATKPKCAECLNLQICPFAMKHGTV